MIELNAFICYTSQIVAKDRKSKGKVMSAIAKREFESCERNDVFPKVWIQEYSAKHKGC